ncbi:MAG: transaldolase [Acidobacteria bacterium]|nr:MAG: transaldolase [Acidobacteriota bacterium]
MASHPLLDLKQHGQSVWLDNLSRPLIRSGELQRLVREDGITGVTSNPAIFNKAMTSGTAYDEAMTKLVQAGKTTLEIYEALAITDIQDACDVLRPVHDATGGSDGFVSLEVSPHLADDTQGTIEEAARLWNTVGRRNLLVKIPGTAAGVPAVEACLTRGINVNVTLLFSLAAHADVIDAHIRALKTRAGKGEDLRQIASVASFFLSRIDVKLDPMLASMARDGEHATKARDLMGKVAVANAKLAYGLWQGKMESADWRALAAAGARVQKPLWASTSTKNPDYSDVMYVEPLIGPHTVNTMPDETIVAFKNHGQAGLTVTSGVEEARATLASLADLGIDMDRVTDELLAEGITKFVKPFDDLLAALEAKRESLATAG